MRVSRILCAAFFVFTAIPAFAGSATDALSACLADNTTGKERKDLAKWIFVAMAVHPELKDFSNITDAQRAQADQAAGAIVSRLLTQNCVDQAKQAVQVENGDAFKNAFGVLGQLAMRELMANPEVGSAIGGFERYLDRKKIDAVLSDRGTTKKP